MDISHQYNVSLRWTADRRGELASPELTDRVTVATPPPFPRGTEGIWSPEHLLIAAVSSCLMTTFLAIAENSKLRIGSYDDRATGTLENVEGKLALSEVILRPRISVTCEADIEKAERLIQKADANCLISRSVKSQIILKPEINAGELISV